MKDSSAIAVVAMSGVFPGATGTDRFWQNILHRVDTTEEVPPGRWPDPKSWIYDASPAPDSAYAAKGCFISNDQHQKLRMPQTDIAVPQDPLYRWVLHAAGDALEQCFKTTIDLKRIGVILAAIALPTRSASDLSRQVLGGQLLDAFASGREIPPRLLSATDRVVSSPAACVSSVFGLGGASYTLDAACASSLYALNLACDELAARRADLMITGGVSAADCLYTQIGFSQLRALSPSGRCAPFDQSADGLVVGEGAGILVIKRLEDALRDEDAIYGVIRGIGLSNDMRGNLLAPESEGQLRAMRAAYAQAGWQPWEVDLIECHGAGTPVGDAAELMSLRTLWRGAPSRPYPCAIGSVKSMIGHLLTAAGAAGLIKTLLALHHRTLPPSLKYEQAPSGSPLIGAPFKVQTDSRPWPQPECPNRCRRAAVSAFGFGGINGHVLIEEGPERERFRRSFSALTQNTHPREKEQVPSPASQGDIAIVGMEACLGPFPSLSAFQQALFTGRSAFVTVPKDRWKAPDVMREFFGSAGLKGAFLEEIRVELGEFQIPPGEIPDILPQQLLMLKAAGRAMQDAGLPLREPRENMGAVIGIGFDFEATNFHLRWILPQFIREWKSKTDRPLDDSMLEQWLKEAKQACGKPLTATRTLGALGGIVASRLAREFRFGGPSFVVSAEEASGLRALEIATLMLRSGRTDAMLVGAVDLACDERNLLTLFKRDEISIAGEVRPFDERADGTLPGEGAVALILKRLEDARAAGDRIYAVLKGLGAAHDCGNGESRLASGYIHALVRTFTHSGISPADISLVETHGSGIPAEDDLETEALHTFFCTSDPAQNKTIAIGALKPLIGHNGAAAGLCSLVKTALCLFHHLLPGMPGLRRPRHASWSGGPFHFPLQTTYWAADRAQRVRTALVSAMTRDGNCMHALLEQPPEAISPKAHDGASHRRRRPLGPLPFALFLVGGADRNELKMNLERLDRLAQAQIQDAFDDGVMEKLGRLWYLDHSTPTRHIQCLSILAHSIEDLRCQLADARQAIQKQFARTISARGGICYLPDGSRPHGGELAFVFPGSGNHYVGMGRTLAAHWPEILQDLDLRTGRLRAQMLPHLYDPWRSDWPSGWQNESYQALTADPLPPIFGQVVFGLQMTLLLRSFNLQPEAAIGYSLGESAAFYALGAWPDHGQMLDRLAVSDLFTRQLCGPCLSLRKAWQLPDDQRVQWCAAVVNQPAGQVDRAIAAHPYARRLIINTPNECVIGGLKESVLQVIERLGCEALFLDGVVTVHCDAAQPVAAAYKQLHRFPTTPVEGVRFYSCATGQAYDLTSEAAANAILEQALNGFDFTRTIKQAYADGVRLFVEVGPQASCTRMVRQILTDRHDFIAFSAHGRGEDEVLTLLKCLGTLAAAGRPVDLAPLYDYAAEPLQTRLSAGATRVPVGGPPWRLPALPLSESTEDHDPDSLQEDRSSAPVLDERTPSPHPVQESPPPPHALEAMIEDFNHNVAETTRLHEQFLSLSTQMTHQLGQALQLQNRLLQTLATVETQDGPAQAASTGAAVEVPGRSPQAVRFSRQQCLEFAMGSVGKVFGPHFEAVDSYKCRVRLPDEPLMLVDRVIHIEGQMGSLGSGRVVTEHDVLPGAWYLDGGRAPLCIAVEAGQADLFLSSYLGIDHRVKGERSYRLLDAKIHFHRGLPRVGETIRYDIHIDKFVRQGETYLFFFRFEGHIGGEHLITMTDGCAGFFTEQEVQNSGGIILTDEDRAPGAKINGDPYEALVPMIPQSFSDDQIDALRCGDAGHCFGSDFAGVVLPGPLHLPGGRMRLIDRILSFEPAGGRWGLGQITAQADIHPDDWFLTCHFIDDKVMPGTLMYECCAHTLRVLLLRLGWVTDSSDVAYEPFPGIACRLKCRGPVTPQTRQVDYTVEIKEVGYAPEPYALADAHMHADGRCIVFFKDMSLQMRGVTRRAMEDFWLRRKGAQTVLHAHAPEGLEPGVPRRPLFTRSDIVEFATGSPSKAFGPPYEPFDHRRRMARLPAPPFSFIDRITLIEPPPWVLKADGWIEAQCDVSSDAWYFAADRSGSAPLCVLMEMALQPCGWLAAYAGSALRSTKDLRFRNLGGAAVLHRNVLPGEQTLTMRTRLSQVSEAVDMIIEHFEFEVHGPAGPVYTGTTYFGFFTDQALSQQAGLRQASPYAGAASASPDVLPGQPPFAPEQSSSGSVYQAGGLQMPSKALRMIDAVDCFEPAGGPHRLGYVRGRKRIDPSEWFFRAHFYQDPVYPGSLGVDSFLQLLKYAALQRWPQYKLTHRFELLCGKLHEWQYRGQVIPSNRMVTVEALVTAVEDGAEPLLAGDGWLQVDDLYIYKMSGFGLKLVRVA